MRYLGIDYGDKRIGIALSDERGVFAFPFSTIENDKKVINSIKKICSEQEVEKIIVGLPLSFSMQETEQTQKVKEFAQKLGKGVDLPIEFENEILTSKMAGKQGVGKQNIDESSAALILQGWLDRNEIKN
ncbi:MAG: hypothetical protein US71_C0005G0020 [Parcubacteria group bacterium GW2011_GWD2_38_12]|nr:MAG: hypothetical protein US61_C0029G0004 [Parcubacteria group bacterium GW2011_GWE2_37_8]KKQ52170.1 MAG: hypothetical protein US71_C0005G0020 [Parcubacteria group bacterium GW2011_GWD2_38_12]KKQ58235.1 MAG: hypothetical protein US78_C0020G0018 [Parcubacteria group bacterium GW2011_GWD1_38_16]